MRGFRDFLYSQGFTEIHTPKIGAKGAEGGSNLFRLDYFHHPAVLAQSPQFYKQMMVGVFDRVFETGPVFRAEKHNTKRHLNEYTSLDFEMGYIDSFEDIMAMETGFLQYMLALLEREYAPELKILDITLPKADKIPAVRFDEAKQLASEKYGHKIRNPYDLEPEEEVLIGRYFQEEYGSDFVFVTHYPSKKRPFYAMDDPADPKFTLSFDLLFEGLEVTTGGQRIHEYQMLLDKIAARGMTEEGHGAVSGYLQIRHAAPRRTWHRPGASDHEAGGRGQRAGDHAVPARLKQTGALALAMSSAACHKKQRALLAGSNDFFMAGYRAKPVKRGFAKQNRACTAKQNCACTAE